MGGFKEQLEFAKDLARTTGRLILDNRGDSLDVKEKDGGDLVTRVDMLSHSTTVDAIAQSRFNYKLLSEENYDGSLDLGQGYTWIVDPLNGTTNFIKGNDRFSYDLALIKDGEVVAGVVYDPVHDKLYFTQAGQQAYCNDRLIKVSVTESLGQTIVNFDAVRNGGIATDLQAATILSALTYSPIRAIRQTASAGLDLCDVASGKYDAHLAVVSNSGHYDWDVAAGGLIVQNAGGKVTDFSGNDKLIGLLDRVASNTKLHPQLIDLIKRTESGKYMR